VTANLWIALGFLAALVTFLGVTIYFPPRDNTGRATLKFFTALSAGFSGGFFTGNALFKYQQQIGGTNIAISGAAGCALFFTVWLIYPKVFKLADAIAVDVPAGWTFRGTVETVARTPCEHVNFRADELQAVTRAAKVSAATVQGAILHAVGWFGAMAATTSNLKILADLSYSCQFPIAHHRSEATTFLERSNLPKQWQRGSMTSRYWIA
jgi:hypothetical protein